MNIPDGPVSMRSKTRDSIKAVGEAVDTLVDNTNDIEATRLQAAMQGRCAIMIAQALLAVCDSLDNQR